jgi:hypothetical protein
MKTQIILQGSALIKTILSFAAQAAEILTAVDELSKRQQN